MGFLTPRKVFSLDRWDGVVLALYSLLVGWTIAHHEPWFDESQAWLIARDSSLGEMITHRLRYEGSPALWHLLLWVLTRLDIPFAAFNWVVALFAVAAIAVFLRYAPLPRLFRVLIPFTFFFAYQYAVIARSYVLFALLVFGLCVLFRQARPRVVAFAAVAALLANLNLHGLLLSFGMVVLYARELMHRSPGRVAPRRGPLVAGAAVYGLSVLFAVYVAFPPPDIDFAIQDKVKKYNAEGTLAKIFPPERLPASAPPLDPALFPALQPVPPMNRVQRDIWDRSHGTIGTLTQQKLLNRALAAAALLDFPISSWNTVALAFWAALLLWLWSRRGLALLLPYVVLFVFEVLVWTWVHQTGLLLIGLLAAIWIAMQRRQVRGPRWADGFFAVTALLVVVTQIGWTAYAVQYDTRASYDPGRYTRDFLLSHYPGRRLAVGDFLADGVQPFSRHNMFINMPKAFWIWSSATDVGRRRTEAIDMHPDVVVVAEEGFGYQTVPNQWMDLEPVDMHYNEPTLRWWRDHGWHETHRFCGARPFRFGISNTTCDVIFEPDAGAAHGE